MHLIRKYKRDDSVPSEVRRNTVFSSDMTSRQPEPTHVSRKKYYSYASVVSLRSACDPLLRCVGHTKATKASATIESISFRKEAWRLSLNKYNFTTTDLSIKKDLMEDQICNFSSLNAVNIARKLRLGWNFFELTVKMLSYLFVSLKLVCTCNRNC